MPSMRSGDGSVDVWRELTKIAMRIYSADPKNSDAKKIASAAIEALGNIPNVTAHRQRLEEFIRDVVDGDR